MPNSGYETAPETCPIPAGAGAAGITHRFIYRGQSMSPTFRPGYLLYVRPTARDICRGDVVVYPHPFQRSFVTHRVVAVTSTGLITRGDNNSHNDDAAIAPEQVIGRVEMVEENGRLKHVVGGQWGLLFARLGWNVRQAGVWFRRTFGGPYRLLRRSGIVRRLWHPSIIQLRITSERGALIKYVCGGRVVARWWQQQNRFECDKPYDLVIPRPDEK